MRKAYSFITIASLTIITALTRVSAEPAICAATQTYSAIEPLKSQRSFKVLYGTSEDLEAKITNHEAKCDIVISSDEKLPLILIRSGLGDQAHLHAFVRAPLVLWSADPSLLDSKALAVSNKQLRSLAVPKAELTPAGYAATQIVRRSDFPTEYLKGRIYRPDHEFQVLAMVESGNVQAGFLTKPLILGSDGMPKGSYWQVPRDNYPELDYYILLLNSAIPSKEATDLYTFFKDDPAVLRSFQRAGFDKPLH
ncbi:MAG: molybdate ABC transporter substrate-binding protein [Succinatimonas hippei]|nr:molybdate ABC transporter substrate-binding protein [Succinatimonas hippei]